MTSLFSRWLRCNPLSVSHVLIAHSFLRSACASPSQKNPASVDPLKTSEISKLLKNNQSSNERPINEPGLSFEDFKKQQRITLNGGARRDRTDDLLRARQALSQLSYGP
jgi:hypothetical protein